jgi:hypothetical protein
VRLPLVAADISGYIRSVTSGQRSLWKLRVPGPWGTAVQVALIVLKLTGVIGWSWWWVLAPLWVTVTLAAALAGGFLLVLAGQRRAGRLRARPVLAKLVFPAGRFPGTPGRQSVRDDRGY